MSVSNERLAEIIEWAMGEEAECLQDDMPVSAGYYADVVRLLLSRRSASNTGGVEDAEKTIAVFGRKLFEAQTQTDPEIAEATNKNRTSLYTNSLAAEAEPVALIDRAMSCDTWPSWLSDIVELTNQAADAADMSTEQAVAYGILQALTHPCSSVSAEVTATHRHVKSGVKDTWFTDRALPVMALSGDIESDHVIKLHFRRPVTDADRQDITNALNLHNAAKASPATMRPVSNDMLEWLEMARELIREAKGAEGPSGGFVTDHLDAAENWMDKIESALASINGGRENG